MFKYKSYSYCSYQGSGVGVSSYDSRLRSESESVHFYQIQLHRNEWWNKWHCVENKTESMHYSLKMYQISLLAKYTKWLSRGIFLHLLAYVNAVVNVSTRCRWVVSFTLHSSHWGKSSQHTIMSVQTAVATCTHFIIRGLLLLSKVWYLKHQITVTQWKT
jgi:hypothetical protein